MAGAADRADSRTMKEFRVSENESGQRFDKYLHRKLSDAPNSFLYKMLRKKNITLNGKKASGSELLQKGDLVALFLSDETIEKFGGQTKMDGISQEYLEAYELLQPKMGSKCVLYENSDFLAVRKPAGILSQKSVPRDVSVNEWLIGYLLKSGFVTEKSLGEFKPSVCSRLDRNTGGIVLCGKTLRGSQMLTKVLRDRTIHKYYQAVVEGKVTKKDVIEGYLAKDHKSNKVTFSNRKVEGGSYSKTVYRPMKEGKFCTLLELELITGKTHQLRAHLSHIGHPIVGDPKYGDREKEASLRRRFGLRGQLLWCWRIEFPKENEQLKGAERGLIIECLPPAVYRDVLE